MLSSLDERVKRLEATNRLLWGILLVLCVPAAVAFGWSQENSTSPVISAEAFQLVDGEGKILAALKLGEAGPEFTLLDPEGRKRLVLTQESDQTGLFILDTDGQIRVGAAQFAHGGGGFALHGPEAKGAAVLYLKGDGSLTFFDAEGAVTERIPAAR